MQLLEVSSPKSSAVSLDLLNLYVVNQLSTKKDNTGNVRKPVHVDITEDEKKPIKRHNLELPTSPLRTQHKSNLDDLQSRLQKQVLDSRRQHLSEKVKHQHKLSQVMELGYVDSSMENEDNMARDFSACPLSSSGFQFSNCTQLSEENFNTNLMGNISEQIYEKKLQNQPGNSFDQDPWNTKPPSQCSFRKSDTVLQELFKPFDKPDYLNSARKNPVIIGSNGPENSEGIKEPIFDAVKETAELKDGSGCSFRALFEDESQPIHNNPSTKHFNPFSNQSNNDIFFTVPDVQNQTTNRNNSCNPRRVYPAINEKEDSVDRPLEGIFTAPERVFLKSNNVSSTSYKETTAVHKTHRQNCHEGHHYFMPCEKKERRANLKKIETFAYRHGQQNSFKEYVQNYSRKKSDERSLKETSWNQNHVFVFEEFTTAQKKGYKFGLSSYLHEIDVESPLSSQSHSYSPRQTESYLSSSPDTPEEEDKAKKKEYLNERPLKTHGTKLFSGSASREATKRSHTQSVAMKPRSTSGRKEANNLQEKDSNFSATEEENKTHTALSQGPSHPAFKREHVTSSSRCNAWSQTEGSVTVEKVDVGTQCGTPGVCSCGGALPAARSPGELSAPGSAGPAGGHERPAQEAPQPAGSGSAAGTDAFSSETEYLSLAGRRTLEVLNYIDKMKARDKQRSTIMPC
ncbi:regulator of DNA class I crossover intermediates 1 [Taeniopygia guttata]|uniref:regulator of DNA class I crossover intermediates 1 n=1 Tax=Taeniopygia guttata TaxID=59729 RepID=UPI003BB94CB2